jgi:hypothetical protein
MDPEIHQLFLEIKKELAEIKDQQKKILGHINFVENVYDVAVGPLNYVFGSIGSTTKLLERK